MQFSPIGIYQSQSKYKQEAPRQGIFAHGQGSITLHSDSQLELALRDLDGFERIWLIYSFHLNQHWKPLVSPPIPPANKNKVGCFASRSPYRPNNIGLSCVKLEKVDGLTLWIRESDLLDGTPILDIKPYIPQYDSFPNVPTGWMETRDLQAHQLIYSELFTKQTAFLLDRGNVDLRRVTEAQLVYTPIDVKKKRVEHIFENNWVLAFRTWRIYFQTNGLEININRIESGYSSEELDSEMDIYADKQLHKEFIQIFSK